MDYLLAFLAGAVVAWFVAKGFYGRPAPSSPFIACPSCAEPMRAEGTVCPHCHREIQK